jgi:uncharacterized protein (DUF1800 family)
MRFLAAFLLCGMVFGVPALVLGMDAEEARHLLARTGFGGTAEDIERLLPLDDAAAVQALLDGARKTAMSPPPSWVDGKPPDPKAMKGMDEEARKALQQERQQQALELKGWWFEEMIRTDSPLTERMTLFWHNHFTSSLEKVKFPPLLFRQNLLLREHALGNFRTLLHAVARDPAMVLYLDSQSNLKGKPNENFARELLELFTLGEGQYTEEDIKQAARAFTGWQVDRQSGTFRVLKRQHDDAEKSFLGRTGPFDGDDILDIVLEQPRTAEFVVEKLWKEFVSDAPERAEVKRLGALFRDADYELKPLLKALFLCPPFLEDATRGGLVKSPVELIVGTVRMFGIPVKDPSLLARASRRLGQDLFDPPNVKGWPGGTAWITSSTLLARRDILERGIRGREMKTREGAALGLDEWLGRLGGSPEERLEKASRILLPVDPLEPQPTEGPPEEAVARLVLDPVYQLK